MDTDATAWLRSLGADQPQARDIAAAIERLRSPDADRFQVWAHVSKNLLSPCTPFAVHQEVARRVLGGGPEPFESLPLWQPSAADAEATNIARFMRAHPELLDLPLPSWAALPAHTTYTGRLKHLTQAWNRLQAASVHHPNLFWPLLLQAMGIVFDSPPACALRVDPCGHPDSARFFPGALFNVARVALGGGKHDPDAVAVVAASEQEPCRLERWTFRELAECCERVAAVLRRSGARPGFHMAILGPLNPAAVVLYLAALATGATVVSISESFSAAEIATRCRVGRVDLLVVQATMVRGGRTHALYSKVKQLPPGRPAAVVIYRDAPGPATPARSAAPATSAAASREDLAAGDVSWESFVARAESCGARADEVEALGHPVEGCWAAARDAESVVNILFSSGTTGEPKAIPWTQTAALRPAVDAWSLLDVRHGDVVAFPTSLGWMMGPWSIFAALVNGAALALFDGAPTGRAFGQFVTAARVSMLGVVPSLVRAWRAADCMRCLDWASVRCFASTGEASNAEDYHWLMARAGYKPIMEYVGGTELAGAYCSSTFLHASIPSTFASPTLGHELFMLVDGGAAAVPTASREARTGEVALRVPLLGGSQRLLNRSHEEEYLRGMPRPPAGWLRRHGDEMEVLRGCGHFRALGRCDDTMNLGGIKVSSVEVERACMRHVPAIREAAAVAVTPPGGGPSGLLLSVVLEPDRPEARLPEGAARAAVQRAAQDALRTHLNPLFKVQEVRLLAALPRNASNKVMRRSLRAALPSKL